MKEAIADFNSSLRSWRIWYSLGMQDILLRYRGSVLGPFWFTISSAITVYSMGYLYGAIFGIDRQRYLPYFASGMITWNFISMIVNESTKVFLESKSYLENIKLPCIVYVFRLVFRNVIILAHNFPVYLSVLLIFHIKIGGAILLLLPGIALLSLNGIFYGTIIGMLSSRFPDVGAIMANILQVFFFITPILWMPDALPARFDFLLTLNPFVYLVSLIRNPLLGLLYTSQEILALGIITLSGMLLSTYFVSSYRSKIIFWL